MRKFKTLWGGTRTVKYPRRFKVKWNEDSRSIFQTDVKLFLKHFWRHDDVYEEFPIAGTKLSFDLYNETRGIAVEVQGRQHTKYVKFFHGSRVNFLEQLKRDKMKEDFAEANGLKLVLIYPEDELNRELFAEFGVELV
jgi:hypothetical protein